MGRVLTLEEAAAYLRVHPTTLSRLLRQNKFPGFKIGSYWRFFRDVVDEWVAANTALLSDKPETPPEVRHGKSRRPTQN